MSPARTGRKSVMGEWTDIFPNQNKIISQSLWTTAIMTSTMEKSVRHHRADKTEHRTHTRRWWLYLEPSFMKGKFSSQIDFCFLRCISSRFIPSISGGQFWPVTAGQQAGYLTTLNHTTSPWLPISRQDEGDSHLLFQSVTDESVTRCVGRFLRPVNDHLDNSTSAGPVVTWSRAHIPFPVHCTHPLSSPLTTASGRGRVGYIMLFNISTLRTFLVV